MTFQVHRPPLSGVPCLSTTVLLLMCFLLSCSHPKSCTCSGSDQDQFGNLTLRDTFDRLPGFLLLTNTSTCRSHREYVFNGLGSYMKTHYLEFNLSERGWFFIHDPIGLWEYTNDGKVIYEASFSIFFTMSIYQPNNQTKVNSSLVFAIQPYSNYDFVWFSSYIPPNGPSNPTYKTVAGSQVSVQISTMDAKGQILYPRNIICMQIGIEPPSSSVVANEYSVWIDYDHVGHSMSIYVDAGEGTPKPANAIADKIINISHIMPPYGSLALFSSMGQLLQLHKWSSTVDNLPNFYDPGSEGKTIILSSVFGSAAATAITAVVAYFYFNSKYRRWKTEQDKLAKTMQRLPGVPSLVDYADIRKATKNFHETMRLGKGGFGAVYICTLPAAASRAGRAIEVAVKKFMREVEDQRYEDFLAEVSIINRLRHKNIVPLVGWSYNKGEPLLIYEYMTNGSLDQHLFRRGNTGQQKDAYIWQWHTRYGIAGDIARGLHYVHHEHEPMVLHRDIKASNILLDSTCRARLGDFGIASTVAVDRSSVTGIAGTWGYIAPEYALTYRSTRQTDAYAFGVLILEVVTGKKNGDVPPDDDHITDWVWRLHQQGKLLEAVDGSVLTVGDDQQDDFAEEAERLLLLGLACTNPNPSNRPSMGEAVQVITKLAPPPDVPLERPAFMWPPEDWRSRNSVYSTAVSNFDGSSASSVELVQVIQEQPLSGSTGELVSVESTARPGAIRGV